MTEISQSAKQAKHLAKSIGQIIDIKEASGGYEGDVGLNILIKGLMGAYRLAYATLNDSERKEFNKA